MRKSGIKKNAFTVPGVCVGWLLGLVFALAGPTQAGATSVSYDVQNLGGATWEYTYTVANDTLGADIEELTVWFDLGLYDNLTPTVTPSDWDPLAINPDPGIPDDGYYDVLALAAGIAPGDSLGGFGVSFDYLGTGTPGSQLFEVVDPNTFALLDDGTTVPATPGPNPNPNPAIPEPATGLLVAMGLAGLAAGGRLTHRID